ncbi:fumarylacetoacetate hydrolase family protein [Neptuniibacter sp.]|uniref:fumarylacetoacetate hydrolase family protein n=1 Tax=Neptuniibacter sp. TaxID=1962643 RepID=UPI00263010B9|nr:fumarylacetoacetate hydrolase family protein [Neptuniibacter sp.]MCP4597154.1 fumarylacetoacetate hydrolase family protein [Neptuniibacter sp.]
MSYQHRYLDGTEAQLPLGKIICVGRNYADHAAELNNPIPTEPMLFIKPASSVVDMSEPFAIPQGMGSVHFETEMSVLIGSELCKASEEEAKAAIVGVGLGLDLTLRDLQGKLKDKGHPWEKAKAFDGSCPLSVFAKAESVPDLQDVEIKLTVNGETRQHGNSSHMLNQVLPLISYTSQFFTLMPGDVILTGTPAGVGPIQPGDQLQVDLADLISVTTQAQ